MKRKIVILLAAALLLSGCGKSVDEPVQTATAQTSQTVAEPEAAPVPSGEVLDLTKLSSTMVYSEVFNMLSDPDRYVGRVVKMNGVAACFANPQTNQLYYACVIADATGCCAQGLEYVLTGRYTRSWTPASPSPAPLPCMRKTATSAFTW